MQHAHINANGESRAASAAAMESPIRAALTWRRIRRPLFVTMIWIASALTPPAAYLAAYVMRFGSDPFALSVADLASNPVLQILLVVVSIAHVAVLWQTRLLATHRIWGPVDLLFQTFITCTITTLVFILVERVFNFEYASRTVTVYFWLLLAALTGAELLGARIVVLSMLSIGIGLKRVVVIGANESAQHLVQTLHDHPEFGYRVIGLAFHASDSGAYEPPPGSRVRDMSATQCEADVLRMDPDILMVTPGAGRHDEILNLMAASADSGIEVRLTPELHEFFSGHLRIERLGMVPMVRLHSAQLRIVTALIKRTVDIAAGVVLLAPYILAMLRFRAGRDPVFASYLRAGRGGSPILIRVFHPSHFKTGNDDNAPAVPAWAVVLPQVPALLRGDVSLVGPQPVHPDRIPRFNAWDKRVIAVRPGIIGYSTANLIPDSAHLAEQHQWDRGYVDRASLAFDLNCILASIPDWTRDVQIPPVED